MRDEMVFQIYFYRLNENYRIMDGMITSWKTRYKIGGTLILMKFGPNSCNRSATFISLSPLLRL